MIAMLFGLAAATASADPRYEVMNAPEGVYWRSEPNWAAAERISGFGVYNGTIIEVHCYQSGTAVEGSADTMWEQATDVGGRGYGSGWVNEHFINDGQPINQPSPGVGPCNPPPPPHEEAPPPPHEEPHSGGGLVFSVFNAEGGIYYRNSPHWADTPQTPGVGVYNGDQVQLICGAFGDAVGPFNDTAWSYVNNLSRSVGEGWVNEHFINDGAADNAFVAGEPLCGAETPGMSSSSGGGGGGGGGGGESPSAPIVFSSTGQRSAFFWPNYYPYGISRQGVGDVNYEYSRWTVARKECDTSAVKGITLPSTVNTLAGWSLGRLGPIYYLLTHQESWGQIQNLILFDPVRLKEIVKEHSCDGRLKPSVNSLLAGWLLKNPSAHLLVLAGEVTEQEHFQGLWRYYLSDIWHQHATLRGRVLVCNYHRLTHEALFKDFYPLVKATGIGAASSGCPLSPSAPNPVPWHP